MTFAVYGNEKKDAGLVVTSETVEALLLRGASVVLPASCKPLLGEAFSASPAIRYTDDETLYDNCDYAVVIGGDGTILKAAGRLYGKNTPIIGVNLGKVGYLTSLEPGDYRRLDGLLHGDTSTYTVEERLMLAFSIERDGTIIREGIALNDVVIAKGDISHMIDVDLACAGRVIANYRCDGLIVSTPTGSTAYSMSAGGAILDPSLDCISLIPCCPYLCINSSPIIFSGHTVLDVTYRKTRKGQAYVNADGTDCFELCHNDVVHLASAEHRTRLIRFDKTDFYELLNKKLSASILEQTVPGFGGNDSEDNSQ